MLPTEGLRFDPWSGNGIPSQLRIHKFQLRVHMLQLKRLQLRFGVARKIN